jgi:CRP-like cAMP-binding protein
MATPAQCEELHVRQGAMIFRRGDPGDEMFVVARGRVRLTIDVEGRERRIAEVGVGDFFGELSLLSGADRTASAEALEDTTLLGIRRDGFAMMMQDDLEIVFRMMSVLGRRLAETDEHVQRLMHRLERVRVVAHGLCRLLEPGGAGDGLPVAELAAALELEVASVQETVAELGRLGAGSLRDGRWRIDGPEHLRRALEVLCEYGAP